MLGHDSYGFQFLRDVIVGHPKRILLDINNGFDHSLAKPILLMILVGKGRPDYPLQSMICAYMQNASAYTDNPVLCCQHFSKWPILIQNQPFMT